MKMSRRAYAEMFGPTVGDRIRLADTELFIEVEQDLTTYGEEVKFGGGKVIRDGMGQSQLLADEVADTVITNALIVDWWGIVKADVGLKNGRIWKIGKAGNRANVRDNNNGGRWYRTSGWNFSNDSDPRTLAYCDYVAGD